ncbi:hypothetical protein [Streptomyces sp. MZ04]|uniref:hypothetical protein n=1 Tax=Streptomyces sp. MZ04 TaxID=2559236 RepID=UPI00107E993D|nr:hypothetical protein [Streptomyces sp. MZ04]TGB00660.1 hypothetical protein E2651_28525 [Streptomyces sp. MZ04]
MNRLKYASLAGLAAVAVLTGPAVAAATAGDPPPSDTAPQAPAAEAAAPRPALTAKASVASVRAWQPFNINGLSQGMAPGTRVTLQEKQGERWVSLPVSVNIQRNGAYAMRVKLGLKGHNALRIVGGGAVSPVVHVTVR